MTDSTSSPYPVPVHAPLRKHAGPPQFQIAAQLQMMITEGRLEGGHRMIPVSALAEDYGVSQSVIRSALEVLRTGGWIVTRRGRGTFVVKAEEGYRKGDRVEWVSTTYEDDSETHGEERYPRCGELATVVAVHREAGHMDVAFDNEQRDGEGWKFERFRPAPAVVEETAEPAQETPVAAPSEPQADEPAVSMCQRPQQPGDELGRPCPECGHANAVHPPPGQDGECGVCQIERALAMMESVMTLLQGMLERLLSTLGISGRTGPDGHDYVQHYPSTTWPISHGLNSPSVAVGVVVVSEDGEPMEPQPVPQYTLDSPNHLTLLWTEPYRGAARVTVKP